MPEFGSTNRRQGRSLTKSGRSEAESLDDDEASRKIKERWPARSSVRGSVRAISPHGQPWSMDRGKKRARSAIECESTVLPWRLLTEPRKALDVAPDRTRIPFILLCQGICL